MTGQSFRTSDVDEANAILNQVFCESYCLPVRHATGPFRLGLTVDTAGPLTFGIASNATEIVSRVGGLDMTYTVAVPLKGAFPFQFGHDDITADPQRAVVATPTTHLTYRGFRHEADRLFTMTFDRESLNTHLRKLLDLDRVDLINLKPALDLRQGRGAQWWRLASTVALSIQSQSTLATHPMVTEPLANAIMTGLLLSTDHPYREALDAWTQPVPPPTLRRAIAYIEENAHLPLTVTEVSNAVGCGVRGLQLTFKKNLNTTPADYIKRVRMDHAHTALRLANPTAATVAGIAQQWGFNQPGRFAIQYRKIYGVSPSDTLRGR